MPKRLFTRAEGTDREKGGGGEITKGRVEEGVQEDGEPKMCIDLGGQWGGSRLWS